MKRDQGDNINSVIGWLCGAIFLLAPVVALVYVFQQRWRPAFQACMICAMSLSGIIGVRALMLARGVQHQRFAWPCLNLLALLVIPLLAMGIASVIPWPHRKDRAPRLPECRT